MYIVGISIASVSVRVGHRRHPAAAAHEARTHADVQDHAEHRQSRSLHQRAAHETVQRLPQDQLRRCPEVCCILLYTFHSMMNE